jgi:carbon-monoxide dehydrogenase iron sulfur subunit
MAIARILVRHSVCSGCRACEVACVAQHEGRFGTAATRIHVIKMEASGVDEPHVCRLCGRAPCVEACPTGALYRDGTTRAVLLASEKCTGCSACVDACPFGVATLHSTSGLALICDLCDGEPACVKRCATGAIRYAGTGAGARALREGLTR